MSQKPEFKKEPSMVKKEPSMVKKEPSMVKKEPSFHGGENKKAHCFGGSEISYLEKKLRRKKTNLKYSFCRTEDSFLFFNNIVWFEKKILTMLLPFFVVR